MTPGTVARQAPLSMRFSRQEYWSGLPCPPPGDLPNPGIEPVCPALAGRFFTTEPPEKSYSSGTLAIYPRPFACPSTSVRNFSAHLKGYLPQVFLEPIHLSSKLPLILLHYHFFDIVLILQITAAIWSYVFSPASGSDCLNEQCSLPLFSESVYHGTQHWSSTQHPPLLSCKQNSSMWKVL